MTTLNSSLFISVLTVLICSCFPTVNTKTYSITTYFISYDSGVKRKGEKIKYLYQEYNADSSLIYEEEYENVNNSSNEKDWGKLSKKSTTIYSGKQKQKLITELGKGSSLEKDTFSYEYKDKKLFRYLRDKPLEEYLYDSAGRLVQKDILYDEDNLTNYERYYYGNNGEKSKTIEFNADTVYSVDTFIYDHYNKLIENIQFSNAGKKRFHRIIIRDKNGLAVEEKWRKGYDGWRLDSNGNIIEREFYQSNKYFYNDKRQLIKTEFYDIGKLMTVYIFKYE